MNGRKAKQLRKIVRLAVPAGHEHERKFYKSLKKAYTQSDKEK